MDSAHVRGDGQGLSRDDVKKGTRMRTKWGVSCVVCVVGAMAVLGGGLASCSSAIAPTDAEEDGGPDATAVNVVTHQTVGASGGTVTTPKGVTIAIPAGALPSKVTITVQDDPAAPAPSGVKWVGIPLDLGPEGTKFARPISITLTIAAGTLPTGEKLSDLVVFTAPHGSTRYVPLSTSVVDSTHIRATTTHFTIIAACDPTSGPCSSLDDGADATITDSETDIDAQGEDATGTSLLGDGGAAPPQEDGGGGGASEWWNVSVGLREDVRLRELSVRCDDPLLVRLFDDGIGVPARIRSRRARQPQSPGRRRHG
jgi:hypothetical protein